MSFQTLVQKTVKRLRALYNIRLGPATNACYCALSVISEETGEIVMDGTGLAKGDPTALAGFRSTIGVDGEVVTYTGDSHTLGTDDAGKYLRFTVGSDVTVPSQSAEAWSDGDSVEMEQTGGDSIILVPGVGVTIYAPFGKALESRSQYSVIKLKRTATNLWTVSGDLADQP